MKKVLIYCANGYGERVAYSLDDEQYTVTGFIEEKEEKIGKTLLGLPIIHPKDITDTEYDIIIIALPEHEEKIGKKLTDQYNVDKDRIITYGRYEKDIVWQDERVVMLRKCIDILKERNIPGNTAEVGVYQGDFSRRINKFLPDRKLYLFDTFEGFAQGLDEVKAEDTMRFKDTSEDLVIKKMPHPEKCEVRKGYFPATAEGLEDTFCLVSLDADLYEPILAGLKFFYPRLNNGGYIIVHDFESIHYPGVKKAVYEFCADNDISFVPLTDRCSSAVITK